MPYFYIYPPYSPFYLSVYLCNTGAQCLLLQTWIQTATYHTSVTQWQLQTVIHIAPCHCLLQMLVQMATHHNLLWYCLFQTVIQMASSHISLCHCLEFPVCLQHLHSQSLPSHSCLVEVLKIIDKCRLKYIWCGTEVSSKCVSRNTPDILTVGRVLSNHLNYYLPQWFSYSLPLEVNVQLICELTSITAWVPNPHHSTHRSSSNPMTEWYDEIFTQKKQWYLRKAWLYQHMAGIVKVLVLLPQLNTCLCKRLCNESKQSQLFRLEYPAKTTLFMPDRN